MTPRGTYLAIALICCLAHEAWAQVWQYVDPRIGSVGVGRTFPGPSMPFGMAKPGPDCGVLPNAGWTPMPAKVSGFSQTHVSGTGGGQKYGNILIMPVPEVQEHRSPDVSQQRISEDISLGYYATTFENGIRTEITTSERCSFYRISFPAKGRLLIDATHFLGKDSIPNLRERQQFVGADLEVVNSHEVKGYSSVRGGWNNGDAYTVYFWLTSDKALSLSPEAPSEGGYCYLFVNDTVVNVKVGISYVSTEQARKNIPDCDFNTQLERLRQSWEQQLAKVEIEGSEQQKRMFYTALYHTMLMPVCKTDENPKWTDTPYYDDYYAIWDTYRTSTPLLTLLDPQREADIVNSLINIYVHEGYMPDARSGDCNGRTQGGSHGEVMIADAYCKGLKGIDYELALQAMLKDGEEDPGADHEKHGRGGLEEYKRLGYIPYGIPRAGTRTVEYAYDDYCIATVARGLGHNDIADRYMQRSRNWRNLWRDDYEWDGMKGFIMPRDAEGRWLDSVRWGQSQVFHPTIPYTPVTKVAPWYLPWWSTFFYEATSQEYSLSVPHDVEGLVEACGGEEAFRKRLDRFFQRGYYNVQNEPSFLSPCLYHWIGRPDLSTRRVHQIVNDNYSDQPDGLPGNDDSGAMSSWFAFHALGLYPNAGQDYYLLNVPLVKSALLHLSNGRTLHISREGQGDGFGHVLLNGHELADARLSHADLTAGGELIFLTSPEPSSSAYQIAFTLNRQFRTWPLGFEWEGDTLAVSCKQTRYFIPREAVDESNGFCWLTPQQDGTEYHHVQGTFCFISRRALRQLQQHGFFVYDGITWRRTAATNGSICVKADVDDTEMTISTTATLPLVTEMKGNPLGIDWKIEER